MKAKDLVWVVLMGAVVGASFWAAAQRSHTVAPATSADGPPVTLQPVDGTDLHRVVLSARAAERLAIELAPIESPEGVVVTAGSRPGGVDARDSGRSVVPYSAMLYDGRGDTWVYTNPEPLVFIRHRVSVDRIDGNQVVLTEGPPPGTMIVTVGGAELLAAELGN